MGRPTAKLVSSLRDSCVPLGILKKSFVTSREDRHENQRREHRSSETPMMERLDVVYLLLQLDELLPAGSSGATARTSFRRADTPTGPQHRQLHGEETRLHRLLSTSDR